MSIEVIMPQMGESVAEGTIIKWLVREGDKIDADDPLFEISTDKVDAEIPSPAAGVITRILVPEGETVEVGVQVAEIAGSGAASAPAPVPSAPPPAAPADRASHATTTPAAPPADRPHIRSSPIARRLARERSIDLAQIVGTGKGGRVSKKDVLAFIEQTSAAPRAAPAPPPAAPATRPGSRATVPPAITFPPDADTLVEPMTIMRRKISEHMVASRRASAHVASVFEVDMSRIESLRARWKEDFKARHGAGLTYTAFVLHALVPALRSYPNVNASVAGEEQIEYHKHVNVGVAVALEEGLIVPVIKEVERKGMGDIARELQDLGARARSKKLMPDEVHGSTFTLTNPGIYGSLFGVPIINQPNVAILGMGGVEKRVVVTGEDAITVRPMAYLCLSYDHRVIDGAVADQFMAFLKERMQTFPEEVIG